MKKVDYAFIVHSRDRNDLPRKFPLLKYLPNSIFDWLTLNMPPIIVSVISGLRSQNTGAVINGIIVGIPMTAHQLLEKRDLALHKIIQAVKIAKKRGAKYIGLGAMTASLSKGGKVIVDSIPNVCVTTGRTYTAKNIVDYIEFCVSRFSLNKNEIRIAIIGAAGGIGSTVAIALARKQYRHFLLVDLERKLDQLVKKIEILEKHAKDLDIIISHKIADVFDSLIIVAATSSPEIILHSKDVNSGTIVINDAQPSDISPDIYNNRQDVLVIEGGVLHAPTIDCHFNFGLKHKNDIFSCLAETVLLASSGVSSHYSIDDFDPDVYVKLSEASKVLKFSNCMQNNLGIITEYQINKFDRIIKARIK